MIKRHLKLFILLFALTIASNLIGILVFSLSFSYLGFYICDAALLLGLLLFNNIYTNNISSKALKKKIDIKTYYLLKENKSMIWLGVYIHIIFSIIVIIMFNVI